VVEKMANAPVYYALAQARFNPVAAMEQYVATIQDSLRFQGYPLFEQSQVVRLIVPAAGQAPPAEPQTLRTTFWTITRSDRAAGYVLTSSDIFYHTTRYETHDEFLRELLRGLAAVHEATRLDHVSRLGLRYLDAVLPRDGESVEQYLVGGLHGMEFDAVPRYRMTESIFETHPGPLVTTGTLVTRVLKITAPLGFPPDVPPHGLTLDSRFDIKEPRTHAVIDTDHFVEGPMPLDTDKLREELLSLHATIKSVFQAMTTDHARHVWAQV
jgi:uncharacterized protein (TIGR04255 family)